MITWPVRVLRGLLVCSVLTVSADAVAQQNPTHDGPPALTADNWDKLRAAFATSQNTGPAAPGREALSATSDAVDAITQQAYLKASNTGSQDVFGRAVAVWGNTVVIGAYGEGSNATGVNGDQANNSALYSGAAYVFVRDGATWSQQAYLKASNTDGGDHFGFSVAVSGNTAVIGAYVEASNATGVNGDQNDNSKMSAGAAYVFVRDGTTWSQQAYIKASNTDFYDQFSMSLALSGDTLVVAAPREASKFPGIDADQSDNSQGFTGAVYEFVRVGATWSQRAYLKASNAGFGDSFSEVSLSGDVLVVGAYGEASGATGVNGDGSDNSVACAGAAYTFDLALTPWTVLASGLAGIDGVPSLVGSGDLVSGTPGQLVLADAAPSALTALFASYASIPTPFKGGTLATVPVLVSFTLTTSPAGGFVLPWSAWPPGLSSGTTVYFQFAIQDAAAIAGASLSNAIVGTVP